MPTTPEQSNNHEKELDSSENTTLEFQTPEQELDLEQQGQRLAAQIKDMHAKAKTKEDYEAVQKKIAELREMFEVENKELPSVYRNFTAVMEEAVDHVTTGPLRMGDWKWKVYQPTLESGHDTTKLIVSMRTKLDLATYKDADEYDFLKLPEPASLNSLKEGVGVNNLTPVIEFSDVKSYVNETGGWILEVEPQPFDDFLTVVNHIVKKTGEEKLPNAVFLAKLKGSNNIWIDTDYNFSELDKVTDMDFCSFPPKELLYDEWREDVDDESYLSHWVSSGQLPEMFAGKQARSYNINGRWFIEVKAEPEKEAEPAKEKEPQDLESLVWDIMTELRLPSITPLTFTWAISSDKKYITTDVTIPEDFQDTKGIFHKMDNGDLEEFQNGNFRKEGMGINDLIIATGNSKRKPVSLRLGTSWFIKLVN